MTERPEPRRGGRRAAGIGCALLAFLNFALLSLAVPPSFIEAWKAAARDSFGMSPDEARVVGIAAAGAVVVLSWLALGALVRWWRR